MKTDRKTGTLRPLTAQHWVPDWHPGRLAAEVIHQDPRRTRVWKHRRVTLLVMSTIGGADAPDGTGDVIDQWHLSVSSSTDGPGNRRYPARVNADELEHTITSFGLTHFEIDNHHPGAAQHLWIPRDPERRVDCECKNDEQVIVEPDGYTWTNPIDGPCRGCEHETEYARPCPIHTTRTVVLDG